MAGSSVTHVNDKTLGQYFIAVVPPSPVYEEAFRLKEYFKEHFNSKASLNSPPHITLHMPFRWKESKENFLVDSLKGFFDKYTSFTVKLHDFSSFPSRVIFIGVEECPSMTTIQTELRRFCRKQFNVHNADYKDQPFHPHLTLAFRDLKKPAYESAWAEFSERKYEAVFTVDSIVLLKHTGKFWKEFVRLPLGTTNQSSQKEPLAVHHDF